MTPAVEDGTHASAVFQERDSPARRAKLPVVALRILIGGALVLAGLLVAAQLALPGYTANRIDDRLTEGGGQVDVSVDSFPAVRLVFGDGDHLSVSGGGLDLPLNQGEDVFDRLDGFGEVDVHLADFHAGPFEVSTFALTRDGSEPYRVITHSTTTGAELVHYGADEVGLPGGGILQYLTGQTEAGSKTIPIQLNMGLESDDGRIRVVSGGGTVAGYPAGPLAELITAAIVVRL